MTWHWAGDKGTWRHKPYPEYKDSGVEWLGRIPRHWNARRVKSITEEHKQGYYTEQKHIDEGVRLARISDIDDRANVQFAGMPFVQISENEERSFGIAEGDFLFAQSGTIGRFGVVLNPERAVFASYLIRFRFGGVDPEFLRCAFQSKHFQEGLISSLHGGANQNVHAENIKTQSIAVPPSEEQDMIAAFLRIETAKIDALVAKKKRLIELLQEKRTALITRAVTKGLDPNVPMKDSGVEWLGEIPAHWEVIKLKAASSLQTGITLGKSYDSARLETRPYLRVANVQDGYLDLGDIAEIELPGDEVRRYELRAGDVLMTEGGDFDKLGRGYVWEEQVWGCLHQNHIFAVRPDQAKLYSHFLSSVLSSGYGRAYFTATSKQSTNLASTNSTKLKNFQLPLPSRREQEEILQFIAAESQRLDRMRERVRDAIDRLNELRTALVSAAVTGKIDVREIRVDVD